MPRHLLHGGQVDAQVVEGGGLDLDLEAALPTDPPGGRWGEASQTMAFAEQAPGLEHRAEERARLRPASLQPILQGGECRGRQGDLARLCTLAPAHPQLAL